MSPQGPTRVLVASSSYLYLFIYFSLSSRGSGCGSALRVRSSEGRGRGGEEERERGCGCGCDGSARVSKVLSKCLFASSSSSSSFPLCAQAPVKQGAEACCGHAVSRVEGGGEEVSAAVAAEQRQVQLVDESRGASSWCSAIVRECEWVGWMMRVVLEGGDGATSLMACRCREVSQNRRGIDAISLDCVATQLYAILCLWRGTIRPESRMAGLSPGAFTWGVWAYRFITAVPVHFISGSCFEELGPYHQGRRAQGSGGRGRGRSREYWTMPHHWAGCCSCS